MNTGFFTAGFIGCACDVDLDHCRKLCSLWTAVQINAMSAAPALSDDVTLSSLLERIQMQTGAGPTTANIKKLYERT